MGASNIEWTDATWNPVTGCAPDFPCWERCYARRMAKRLAGNPSVAHRERYDGFRTALWPERLDEPLHWRKPRMVFVCSMSDLFHDDVPSAFRDEVVACAWLARQHTYQFLTKRVSVMASYFGDKCPEGVLDCIAAAVDPKSTGAGDVEAERAEHCWPWRNVWPGVTAEDQQRADERIPVLLQIPAAVHFGSFEPLLGPATLWDEWFHTGARPPGWELSVTDGTLDWVIVGGETGPGARPMHPNWVRQIRDQCVEAGVPFLLKSCGEWAPAESRDFGRYPEQICGTQLMHRVGKKRSGRELDGRVWDQFPEPSTPA